MSNINAALRGPAGQVAFNANRSTLGGMARSAAGRVGTRRTGSGIPFAFGELATGKVPNWPGVVMSSIDGIPPDTYVSAGFQRQLDIIIKEVLRYAQGMSSQTIYTEKQLRQQRPYASGPLKRRDAASRRGAKQSRLGSSVFGGISSSRLAGGALAARISPRTSASDGGFRNAWVYSVRYDEDAYNVKIYVYNTRRLEGKGKVGGGYPLQALFATGTSKMVPRPIHIMVKRKLEQLTARAGATMRYRAIYTLTNTTRAGIRSRGATTTGRLPLGKVPLLGGR